jgi:hypothetical protein
MASFESWPRNSANAFGCLKQIVIAERVSTLETCDLAVFSNHRQDTKSHGVNIRSHVSVGNVLLNCRFAAFNDLTHRADVLNEFKAGKRVISLNRLKRLSCNFVG